MLEQYFKNIYAVLFNPNEAFDNLKNEPCSSEAAFTLVWVNIFFFSLKYIFTAKILNPLFFIFLLICFLFGVFFAWVMFGVFFEYVAKIFDKSGNLKTLLYLTSYSIIPWMFIAPLELLQASSDIGYFLGVVFEVLLYFWIIFLYAKSLQVTYDLKFSRSVMLIFLPVVTSLFAIFWSMGFFTKLLYIFTV